MNKSLYLGNELIIDPNVKLEKVELTKAEYNALTEKKDNILYVVTDADNPLDEINESIETILEKLNILEGNVDNFVIIPLNPQIDTTLIAKCTFTEEEKNAVMEAYNSDVIPIFKFTMPDGIIKYEIPTKVTNGFDIATSNLKVPLFLNFSSENFSINILNITKEIWLGFYTSLLSFKGSLICSLDYVFNIRSNSLYYNNNNKIEFRLSDRKLSIVKTYSENDQLVLITNSIIHNNKRYYCEIRFPIGPIVQDTNITYIFKPETTLLIYGTNNQNLKLSTGGGFDESIQLYNNNYGWRKVSKSDNSGYQCLILISDVTRLFNAENNYTYGFSGEIDYFRIDQGTPYTLKIFILCTCGYNSLISESSSNFELYTSYYEYIVPVIVKRADNYYLALVTKGSGRTFTMKGVFVNCLLTFEEILGSKTGNNKDNFPEIDGIEYIYKEKVNTYYRFNNLVSLDNLSTYLLNQVKTTHFIVNYNGSLVEDEANEITINDETNKIYTLTELVDICKKYYSNLLHNLLLKIGTRIIVKNPIIYKGTNVTYGDTYLILVNSLSSSSDTIAGLMLYDIYVNSGLLKLFYKHLKYYTDGNS